MSSLLSQITTHERKHCVCHWNRNGKLPVCTEACPGVAVAAEVACLAPSGEAPCAGERRRRPSVAPCQGASGAWASAAPRPCAGAAAAAAAVEGRPSVDPSDACSSPGASAALYASSVAAVAAAVACFAAAAA